MCYPRAGHSRFLPLPDRVFVEGRGASLSQRVKSPDHMRVDRGRGVTPVPGLCTKCVVRQPLRALLPNESGEIRPELLAFYENLANYERATTVLRWLDQSSGPAILRELSADSDRSRTPASTSWPRANPSHTYAASWSPPGPCRHATSRWPGSSVGPAASSPIATIPVNNSCSTPTRCGISCGDCGPAWAVRIPPTGRPSSFNST